MSAISSLTHAISIDPFSGEQIGAYPFDTDAALEAALQRAKAGYGQWRQVSLGQRSSTCSPWPAPSKPRPKRSPR